MLAVHLLIGSPSKFLSLVLVCGIGVFRMFWNNNCDDSIIFSSHDVLEIFTCNVIFCDSDDDCSEDSDDDKSLSEVYRLPIGLGFFQDTDDYKYDKKTKCSSPALESQKLNTRLLLSIPLCVSAFCCFPFPLSFCLTGPLSCIFLQPSSTSAFTRSHNVTACTVAYRSLTQKSRRYVDQLNFNWRRLAEKKKEKKR